MAISPTSDIVLGVTLAADPEKYKVAVERLRQLGATRAAEAARVTAPPQTIAASMTSSPRPLPATGAVPGHASGQAHGQAGQAKAKPDVFGQLEAFVLQSFIQTMLPQNAEHVFGKGAAGEVWKSMLAEKLANEMAASGQVGLAKRLAAGRLGAPPATPASLSGVLPYLQPEAPSVSASASAPTIALTPAVKRS